MNKSNKVTLEFYGDPLLTQLIGAVDVPAKRMIEAAQAIGKTVCKVIHADVLETVLIGPQGETIDHIVIHR